VLIVDAEVDGERTRVRVDGGVVSGVAPDLRRRRDEEVVDARGGALLPGLHDHHVHLLAWAAARTSVLCGPPRVSDRVGLAAALRSADHRLPPGEWLRGIGYVDSVAGSLDRQALDELLPSRPLRLQHRSGALWILNSAGLRALGLDRELDPAVERDGEGRLTGRLWRWDVRLGELLGEDFPDLRAVGGQLASLGVTGVTDASPDLSVGAVTRLQSLSASGVLPPGLRLLAHQAPGPQPLKILLHDHELPDYELLRETVRRARASRRPVAVHVVTRVSLALVVAVLTDVGVWPGDRLEHAAVVPPELRAELARLGLRVVTQPTFVAERGDQYLDAVEPDDQPHLYPYASLLSAGIAVAPSSDAPFGDPDPWRGMAAASRRRSRSGRPVCEHERVPVETALAGYLSALDEPGGPPRAVAPGVPADLCLLHAPLDVVISEPSARWVRATFWSGRLVHGT
jgi:predicted amidohydrolase YtcJ